MDETIALDTREKIKWFHEIYTTDKYENMTRESKNKLLELGEEKYREFIKTKSRHVEVSLLPRLNENEIIKLYQFCPEFNNFNGKNVIILEKSPFHKMIRIYGAKRIDDEILFILKPFIHSGKYKRVVFYSMEKTNYMNRPCVFDFCPSLEGWSEFAEDIEEFLFEGVFDKNQFRDVHIKAMKRANYLGIGATNYYLMHEKCLVLVEDLPMIKTVAIGAWGAVHIGKTCAKWFELLKQNGCIVMG